MTVSVWERPLPSGDLTIDQWRQGVTRAYGPGPYLDRQRLADIYVEFRRNCVYGEPGIPADSVGRLIGEVLRLLDGPAGEAEPVV